ncbi:MAG TPA: hypothetical protein EYH42_09380 [Sulfurovum sp.]|nr:hypothetical protein [Sulfurovum sp.]
MEAEEHYLALKEVAKILEITRQQLLYKIKKDVDYVDYLRLVEEGNRTKYYVNTKIIEDFRKKETLVRQEDIDEYCLKYWKLIEDYENTVDSKQKKENGKSWFVDMDLMDAMLVKKAIEFLAKARGVNRKEIKEATKSKLRDIVYRQIFSKKKDEFVSCLDAVIFMSSEVEEGAFK